MHIGLTSFRNSPSVVDPSSISILGRCKDLNHFPPTQTVHFETEALSIQTVGNEVTGETILAYVGEYVVKIISVKPKDRTLGAEDGRGPLSFDFKVLHTAIVSDQEGTGIRTFAISPDACLTVPPYKLRYAVSLVDEKSIYVYNYSEDEPVDKQVYLQSVPGDYETDEVDSKVLKISTAHRVSKMALERNRFLGGILDNKTLAVWDLELPQEGGERQLLTFPLNSDGVHIAWHSSDKYAVMVVEAGGWIKFFNIYKQICYLSVSIPEGPLYSADWATLNPLLIAAGSSGQFSVINSTKLNSNCFSTFQTPQENISEVKFNPEDDRVIATLARVPGVLRLWKSTLNNVWTFQNSELRDISWIYGKSYIVALGFRCLYIFDGSCM